MQKFTSVAAVSMAILFLRVSDLVSARHDSVVTQSDASAVFYRSNSRFEGSNPPLGFCFCVVLCRSRHFVGSVCRPGSYQTTYIQEAGYVACMKMNINVKKIFVDISEDSR